MSKYPTTLLIHVTKHDIEHSNCSCPTDCMIHHAVKRTIGGHGYVKVDARGVFITRRDDYREHAVLPRSAYAKMKQYDINKKSVTPFSFRLHFNKTTKIHKYSDEQHEQRMSDRRKRRSVKPEKKYNPAERYTGIAFAGEARE